MKMFLMKNRLCSCFWSLALLLVLFTATATQTATEEQPRFIVLGVSGTLQDGFPLRDRLDYRLGHDDESKAIFLGKALVRGYKAYLDIKKVGWREYVPEPGQPMVNHAVLPSGCQEHGNVYWVYIVVSRQVLSVLNHEPRFLSISPDTGLLDLSSNETCDSVRSFARHEIVRQGKTDMDHVAIPLVTAVWYHESFVPSPPIRIHSDGTEITSFEGSLAMWAGVSDEDCTICHKQECAADQDRYWSGIHQAIRKAENKIQLVDDLRVDGPPFRCKRKTRFGVGPKTARINSPFTFQEFQKIMNTSMTT